MAAAMEKRSTMADFIVSQKLGSGSYGQVFKVQRKADKNLCVPARGASRQRAPAAADSPPADPPTRAQLRHQGGEHPQAAAARAVSAAAAAASPPPPRPRRPPVTPLPPLTHARARPIMCVCLQGGRGERDPHPGVHQAQEHRPVSARGEGHRESRQAARRVRAPPVPPA
jgi:hypothetical protein